MGFFVKAVKFGKSVILGEFQTAKEAIKWTVEKLHNDEFSGPKVVELSAHNPERIVVDENESFKMMLAWESAHFSRNWRKDKKDQSDGMRTWQEFVTRK